MREWSLRAGDPLSLFLAADARFGVPDYADDQIWELTLSGGDPPAMALETTLGLRALSLRIFPVFFVSGSPVSNPGVFLSQPVVRRFAPNYLQVECRPVEGLTAVCEYWVPHSHAVAGCITLMATGNIAITGECWLTAVLRPAADGAPFRVESAGPYGGCFLRGRAGNISPVLVIAGVAGSGRSANPALKAAFEARLDQPAQVRWAHSGLPSGEQGKTLARALVNREWDPEIARVELENAALPEIETGNAEWDSVLAFSQVVAIQSLTGATRHLPHCSPVIGRNPERGYSLRGDGSDYPSAWNGASMWDLLMVLPVISLAKSELARDILRNFTAGAGASLPDARPGAGGQRANLLAPPLLGQIAWRLLSGREDVDFLHEMRPYVERCLASWFDPAHDRDQDGLPEWERIDSLGPEMPPLWDRDSAAGGGVPPAEVEMPSLAALLLGECHAAARMAELAGDGEAAREWIRRAGQVRQGIERMEYASGYRTQDCQTHASPAGKVIWEGESDGGMTFAVLDEPARLLLRVAGGSTTRPVLRVILSGKDSRGRLCEEEVRTEHFAWNRGAGSCFTRQVWKQIDSIRAEGPVEGMRFRLDVPDLRREDLSNFLPLWSRAATPGRAEGKFLRLADPAEFGSRCGLRFLPAGDPFAANDACADGWMLWNMLMGEAAIRYGKDGLALGWMESMFRAAADGLRTEHAFRSSYYPARPGGSGLRNSLHGIFPVGLFFSGLGLVPAGGNRVWVGGRSIFPFIVTVRYKGLTIRRQADWAEIEFPSGKRRRVEGVDRRLIGETSVA